MSEVDYHLRRQVADVERLVSGLAASVIDVGVQVADVNDQQREARAELSRLRGDFEQFVRQYERTANVQLAQTRIGVLNDELDHKYGHHELVRRTAVGMLQAFDVGLISEETVRAVGEQLMMQTPRYWLAPVLVALSAWAGDDPELCERAVAEAFRRSPRKTSLFLALVLRRQARATGSVRWLRHYLDAQDPRALGRDFAVILESIAQGAFGAAGVELVRTVLDRWLALFVDDEEAHRAQVRRWRSEIDGQVPAPWSPPRFPRLAAVSAQYPALERALGAAEVHRALLDRYRAVLAAEPEPMDRLEDAIDDILDRLVREYDEEELPLRRDLALQEAVMRHGGDMAASQRAASLDVAALETTLDYLTVQTTSALNPTAIGVSASTQRIATASCHEWFDSAHAEFTRDYRQSVPARVDVTFQSNHSVGAHAFQLPAWHGTFAEPMDVLERSLGEHWDRHTAPFIASLAFQAREWVVPLLVFLAGTVFLTAVGGVGGLVIALLGGGVWAFLIHRRYQQSLRLQAEARTVLANARTDSIAQLRAARAELTNWDNQYRAADAMEPQVRELIADLGRAGHGGSGFQRRNLTTTTAGG